MEKRAVVVGGTGLVGSHVIRLLSINNDYRQVLLLLRRSIAGTNEKVLQTIIDFDRLDTGSNPIANADELYCCLGTTMKKAGSKENFYKVDFTYVYQIASLAKQAGVKTFILDSSLGADSNSSIFYSKVKGEIEEKIKELNFEKYIIVRPSLLLGERDEFRMGESIGKILARLFSPFFIGGLKKYKPVKAENVAKAMIEAANAAGKGITIIESSDID